MDEIETMNELIKTVCKTLLEEHKEMKKFTAGFSKPDPCDCEGCWAARKILKSQQENSADCGLGYEARTHSETA
jgi:hypothetical protein